MSPDALSVDPTRQRDLFDADHEAFRLNVRAFMEREVAPHLERWEEAGCFDRSLFDRAGQAKLLCPAMPIEYGGAGVDAGYSAVLLEEGAPWSNIGLSFAMHSDIVANYLLRYGSPALKQAYLPAMAAGKKVGALAMTEPSGGSDVKAIRTRAVRQGDFFRLNGSKTFISNANTCDFVIVVARTAEVAGSGGISLLVVDAELPGFRRGLPLKKLGLRSQDTGELFFDDVMVPTDRLLGDENRGFGYLMNDLSWERLMIAISAVAASQAALDWTLSFARRHEVEGQAVAQFQHNRFRLAEMKTEICIGRSFVDQCLRRLLRGELDAASASMAKYWCSDLQGRVVDVCMQLHGGRGCLTDEVIGRAFTDARAQRIYGGTNEIMKELIARSL